jgi:hypothetical protein
MHEMALSLARSEPPSGGFQLLLHGEPLQTYAFEVSPDLADWTAIATNFTGSDGVLTYQDQDSGHRPMRHYRARRQP